jgi:hypothetical protein
VAEKLYNEQLHNLYLRKMKHYQMKEDELEETCDIIREKKMNTAFYSEVRSEQLI